MIYRVKTCTNVGLQGYEITVEVDSNRSLPTIDIIGLPDAAIKEAKERMRATFRNTDIELPRRKIILNLAPSDIRKEGTRFDLAMAVAILVLIHEGNLVQEDILEKSMFFGELGLDGRVKRVTGLLPSVISAIHQGYKHFFVPKDNMPELAYVQGITLYPIENFSQIAEHMVGKTSIQPIQGGKSMEELYAHSYENMVDFADIKGHMVPKRALTIAASGLHNVLMIGSPGCGKTMLAKALHGILPPLGTEEILHVSQIYSLVGKLNDDKPLIVQRPFRQIHHTASKVSIIGGGRNLNPGEISLAHQGILFFDEVPEFPREVLEVLRQPLEDKTISISRVAGTVQYPANFMFVGTMNPSPCGYYQDPEIPCKSTYQQIKRYQSKVSGPLLDRIDVLLEIPRERIDTILSEKKSASSEELREQVMQARSRQHHRYAGTNIVANAHLQSKQIREYCPLSSDVKAFMKQAVERLQLSPRVIHRTIKLARTIADMEDKENIGSEHIAEALQYRKRNLFVE